MPPTRLDPDRPTLLPGPEFSRPAPVDPDTLDPDTLDAAARHSWRRSARCVGRAGWASLVVRDSRALTDPAVIADDLVTHLREATNGGALRPTMTVLHPEVRVLNEQLIRYADDPQYTGFVASLARHGWHPDGDRFEVLPLAVLDPDGRVGIHPVPSDAVHEVVIEHPLLDWFVELGLRWHAVPAISNMLLELVDGAGRPTVRYPVVFNGWYVSDEISSRNLAGPERYDVLPAVIERLAGDGVAVDGLGTDAEAYWRQRALVEVDAAVLWSFRRAGVKISSPRQEAHRFIGHVGREQSSGRQVPTDWSWVISPIAPVLLPTYHRYYDPPDPGGGPDLVQDPVLQTIGRQGWHPTGSTDLPGLADLREPAGTPRATAGCPFSGPSTEHD